MTSDSDYQIRDQRARRRIAAPKLPYKPARPARRMAIALIGCGGITASHLAAYRKAKYRVVAFMDLDRARAEQRRAEYYPKARVFDSVEELLAQTHAPIVDIATHPEARGPLIRQALLAGKHVLSQKPFVTDLSSGRKLVELARQRGLCLAVNQNGRWAPHVSYARLAIEAGLLGAVQSVDLSVHWDHNWVAGTPFDTVRHLALYDFGIHWFDMMRCYLPERAANRVFASVLATPGQKAAPPLSAQAVVDFDGASGVALVARRHVAWRWRSNHHCRRSRHADQRGAQSERTNRHALPGSRLVASEIDDAMVRRRF